MKLSYLFLAAVSLLASLPSQAQQLIQPYVLAYTASGALSDEVAKLKVMVAAAGFEVLGEYSPYPGAQVIGITNEALKKAAAGEKLGGYAAVEHVSITESKGQLQVSYLNPPYVAAAYRLAGDLADVAATLKSAIGAEKFFGTEKGRTADQLRKFNYMIGMEHFGDVYKLGSHKSYEDAVKTVEQNLRKGVGGTAFVYKLEIPGKQQTVFGVSCANATDVNANDKHILYEVVGQNFDIKTTAYLPYQILVDGKDVQALHMRFRMAVWHPDLTMLTFGKLMSSPAAIEELLKQVAAGTEKKAYSF